MYEDYSSTDISNQEEVEVEGTWPSYPSYSRFTYTGKSKSRLGRNNRLGRSTTKDSELNVAKTTNPREEQTTEKIQTSKTHGINWPFASDSNNIFKFPTSISDSQHSSITDSGIGHFPFSSKSNFLSTLKNDSAQNSCKRNLMFNKHPLRGEDNHDENQLKEQNHYSARTPYKKMNFPFGTKDENKENTNSKRFSNLAKEIPFDPTWNELKTTYETGIPAPLKAVPDRFNYVNTKNRNNFGRETLGEPFRSSIFAPTSIFEKNNDLKKDEDLSNTPLDLSSGDSLTFRNVFDRSVTGSDKSMGTTVFMDPSPKTPRPEQTCSAKREEEAKQGNFSRDSISSILPKFLAPINKMKNLEIVGVQTDNSKRDNLNKDNNVISEFQSNPEFENNLKPIVHSQAKNISQLSSNVNEDSKLPFMLPKRETDKDWKPLSQSNQNEPLKNVLPSQIPKKSNSPPSLIGQQSTVTKSDENQPHIFMSNENNPQLSSTTQSKENIFQSNIFNNKPVSSITGSSIFSKPSEQLDQIDLKENKGPTKSPPSNSTGDLPKIEPIKLCSESLTPVLSGVSNINEKAAQNNNLSLNTVPSTSETLIINDSRKFAVTSSTTPVFSGVNQINEKATQNNNLSLNSVPVSSESVLTHNSQKLAVSSSCSFGNTVETRQSGQNNQHKVEDNIFHNNELQHHQGTQMQVSENKIHESLGNFQKQHQFKKEPMQQEQIPSYSNQQKTYLAAHQPPEQKQNNDFPHAKPEIPQKKSIQHSFSMEKPANNYLPPPPPGGRLSRSELSVNGKAYSVLSVLGKGGSSEVYQVLDPRSSKLLAVKCVDLSCVDKTIADGYLNEIDLLSKLQGCSSVIKMFDYEYVQEYKILYVVMEKGDTDLSHLIRDISKTKKISMSMIIYYWIEMLTAVRDIHERGIIHSDLKPANFLLVSGRLKLIDFGIASSQGDMTSVVKEVTTGTWNYMSPEAIQNTSASGRGFKITYKSDVWSLGCILYNLVYGRTPFSHITNTWGKLQAIADKNHQIAFPDVGAPDMLIRTLRLCLQRDVTQRPTVAQLLNLPYYSTSGEISHIGHQVEAILPQEWWSKVAHLFPKAKTEDKSKTEVKDSA